MSNPVIIIDPGHGGRDSGAVGNGIVEKDYVLGLSKEIEAVACGTGWPVDVVLSRTADVNLSLHAPATLAESRKAILTIALHVDAYPSQTTHGMRVFAKRGDKLGINAARVVAMAAPGRLWRGSHVVEVQEGEEDYPHVWNVLEPHTRPSLLVECGFVTNPADAVYLLSPHGQRGLVAALLVGISQALEDAQT